MITFSNFYINTEVVFKGCKTPKRKPDYISYSSINDGEVSSKYWYGENNKGKYVIRESNHWVNIKKLDKNNIKKNCKSIASCQWHIKTNKELDYQIDYQTKIEFLSSKCFFSGKAYLKDFKKIKKKVYVFWLN